MNSMIQVKYEKTSCYFCNEWFEPESFKEHIIHCGQVLEKCPNTCSAYIQRKKLRSHLKDCPKVIKTVEKNTDSKMLTNDQENRLLIIEQDISAVRSVLNEEIKQRLHLITDVGSLRKHNQVSDEWTQKIGNVLNTLKKCLNQETASRCFEFEKIGEEIKKMAEENHEIQSWKNNLEMNIDAINEKLKQTLSEPQNAAKNLQNKYPNLLANISSISLEIDQVQNQLTKLSTEMSRACLLLTERISCVENAFEEHGKYFREISYQIQDQIHRLNCDLQRKCYLSNEVNTKQITLDYEVKSMKNIVCDTEDKCDRLEKLIRDLNLTGHQANQNILDLEEHLKFQYNSQSVINTRGYLLWKVPEYSKKLQEAKEFDTIIKSPIFSNRPYGYNLRLDAHLNGIGTWKGRNLIACINVLPGEYDNLLQWPCSLEAEITLRDQCPDPSHPSQDHRRIIMVKKRNDDYHANQYIHISHKIIESRNYIREDAIFLEVKVHRSKS